MKTAARPFTMNLQTTLGNPSQNGDNNLLRTRQNKKKITKKNNNSEKKLNVNQSPIEKEALIRIFKINLGRTFQMNTN